MIDAVAPAPQGAYPCSCFPDYGHDSEFFMEYSQATRGRETFTQFFQERVAGPETWEDFLAVNNVATGAFA